MRRDAGELFEFEVGPPQIPVGDFELCRPLFDTQFQFVPGPQGILKRLPPFGDGRSQEQDGNRNGAHESLQDD